MVFTYFHYAKLINIFGILTKKSLFCVIISTYQRSMKKILLILLSVFTISTVLARDIFPEAGKDWRMAKPSKYGYNNKKMKELYHYIADSMNTTSVMVIVGGECIFKYGETERISYIASCRKSVLAMLYGKYVENGTIDLDKTLGEIGITDHGGLLPIEQRATVRHLIQARSGIYRQAANAGSAMDNPKKVPARGSKEPGSYYLYNNWDFNAAGTIFEKLTEKSIYDALEEDLAKPMGFQDWDRSRHKKSGNIKKSLHLAYHIRISTRDMARIGYLMLRNGKWGDKQLISESWHKEMLTPWTTREEIDSTKKRKGGLYGYGYMWWLYDTDVPELKGAYTAIGYGGQYITVIPELDMVIAHKTVVANGRKTKSSEFKKMMSKIFAARKRRV